MTPLDKHFRGIPDWSAVSWIGTSRDLFPKMMCDAPFLPGLAVGVVADTIADRLSAQPGRGLADLANQEPGWIFEANGILHPRAEEYQVQYVMDGMPLAENRSAAYVADFDPADVRETSEMVAGFPAGLGATTLSMSLAGALTDHFLDPPTSQNYTNHGTTTDFMAHYERGIDHCPLESDSPRVAESIELSGFPTVARDKAHVRIIVTATHIRAELDRALEAFRQVKMELGLGR
jgi:hypothetical protein